VFRMTQAGGRRQPPAVLRDGVAIVSVVAAYPAICPVLIATGYGGIGPVFWAGSLPTSTG
jgi:hypothetical protein